MRRVPVRRSWGTSRLYKKLKDFIINATTEFGTKVFHCVMKSKCGQACNQQFVLVRRTEHLQRDEHVCSEREPACVSSPASDRLFPPENLVWFCHKATESDFSHGSETRVIIRINHKPTMCDQHRWCVGWSAVSQFRVCVLWRTRPLWWVLQRDLVKLASRC